MKEIAKHFKGNYREIVLGPLFKLFEAILELFVPLVTASIIDVGVAKGDTAYVLGGGAFMVLLAVLGAAAGLTCQYYAARAAAHFGLRLRGEAFAHMLRLSASQAGEMGAGRLATRITNDVNQLQAGLNMFIRLGTRVPFLAVGGVVMALVLDLRTGLIYLAGTLLITVVLLLVVRSTMPRYGQIQEGQDELFRRAQENLEGVRVIRAFSRQKREEQEFGRAAGGLTGTLIRTGWISAVLTPAASVVANLAIILVVWLGAQDVNAGRMETGVIIALVNYMTQILLALLVAASLIVLFTRAMASAKRVEALLQTKPDITDGPGAEKRPDAPAFGFYGVNFSYFAGAENALTDIDFEVWPGQVVGVIGGTGSGKSTLGHLLLRRYEVNTGRVEVFGADVRKFTLHGLRENFGAVAQGAQLFSGTVRQNLQVAAPAAGDDALWQALETAQAAAFVREKPKGLDMMVAEGGVSLSGGQRQRLTIARAVARRPHILLLDDAASALDYATEAALRSALAKLRTEDGGPVTTFIISQRVASLRGADCILVLDDGKIVGRGRHEDLLETCEVYREIAASQGGEQER